MMRINYRLVTVLFLFLISITDSVEIIFSSEAISSAEASTHSAPPADYYQIDNGSSNFIDTTDDPLSDGIVGAVSPGCALRDALDLVNALDTVLGAKANGCTISNPSGTLPATPIYVINLPAYTYSLYNPAGFSNDDLQILNVPEVYIVGQDPTTTIIEAGTDPYGGANDADNRVFSFFRSTVELSNLTVRNGVCFNICSFNEFTHGGGIINYQGNLTIDNVRVLNNTVDDRGAGIYSPNGSILTILNGSIIDGNTSSDVSLGDGGGIYISGAAVAGLNSTLLIDNSTVSNNTSGSDGGGIFVSQATTASIQNGSLIDGNTAAGLHGGGIHNSWAIVTVDNSTISNNDISNASLNGNGGGIYNEGPGAIVTIQNGSLITGNIAPEGSGIFNYTFGTPQVIITDSSIDGNGMDGAVRYGGGLYNESTMTISNSSIDGNATGQFMGAGIYNDLATGILTITDSTINNNMPFTAFAYGGAMFNVNGATINLTNVQVNGNVGQIYGSGIRNFGVGSTVTLDNVSLNGNATIGNGGGIFNEAGGTIIIQNGTTIGTITPNTANSGGGIFNMGVGSSVSITDSSVNSNTAAFQGGGIYNADGGVILIQNSSVDGNTSMGFSGGGVFNDNGTVTLDNSSVNNNSATTGGGGGIYNVGLGVTTIQNGSTVNGNTAGMEGGGIYNADRFGFINDTATVNIINSTVNGNSAGTLGGGIYNHGPFDSNVTVNITTSIIGTIAQPNTAAHGGGIYAAAESATGFSNVNITNDSFVQGNSASGVGGGGIGIEAAFDGTVNIVVTDSSMSNNSAPSGQGGSIRNIADSGGITNITFTNSIMQSNTAGGDGGGIYSDSLFNFGDDGITTIGLTNTLVELNSSGGNGGAIYQTITGAALSSITVSDSQLLTNTATTNGGGLFNNVGTFSITNSCIVNNSDTAILNNTGVTETAAGNWWGTTNGPGSVATGSGDTVSTNVDYSGFLIAPIFGCPTRPEPEINVLQGATPIADGGTFSFGTTAVGTPVSFVFTVQNTGGADLTLVPPITLPSGFSLNNTFGTTTVAGSGNTTFEVQCDASAVGNYTGQVSFGNNDADENPYNFTIDCNVVPPPEIDVLQGVTSIADGGTFSFGTTNLGTPVSFVFTATNSGTADLTLTPPITVPAGFSVLNTFGTTTVTGGNSTTFEIQCDAATVGNFTGQLSFGNNDADENPYNFDIDCTVVAPEIDVLQGVTAIADGGTFSFGTTNLGTPVSFVFTVENNGTADLTLTSPITVPAGFSILNTFGVTTVTAGNSTTFEIQCDAGAVGNFTGQLSFGNNDADENPYNFDIDCGVIAPEIDVLQGVTAIADGGSFSFGATTVGTAVSFVFTVENNGTADLTLTPPINLPAGFSVLNPFGATTVTAGNSTTFEIQCDAGAVGNFTGQLSFDNDDGDENPYNFDIDCTVNPTAPEIDVLQGVTAIADGGTFSFGATTVGTPVSFVFTVENNGTGDLTLTPPIAVPAGFSILNTFGATTVTPGNSTTFEIQCDAVAVGNLTGQLSFANNDGDENPYNFDIDCDVTPVPVPEIDVLQGVTVIADGGSFSFGATTVGTPISFVFTVEYNGTTDLTLIPPINLPAGFSVLNTFGTTTVTAGNSTTFEIQCDAGAVSNYSGELSFANDDGDENPYNFDIDCVVSPALPEIDVLQGVTSIVDGSTFSFGATTIGTPVSFVFTVENNGTGDLTLTPPITVPAGFSVLNPFGVTTVTPGNSTTFEVQCDAVTIGVYNDMISFGNDDGDENPYNFDVDCTVNVVPLPEINVLQGGTAIADGGTFSFGSTTVGNPIGFVFTVENLGTADLTLIPPINLPAGFSVLNTFGATTVTSGNSTTFEIQCDAGAVGTFNGTLSFDNDDGDENPYNFDIECNVLAAGGAGYGSTPAPNSAINVGTADVGSSTSLVLSVFETGDLNLTVTVPVGDVLSGANASDFIITNGPPFTIVDGSGLAQDITILCTPSAEGSRSAVLTFETNDPLQPTVSYNLMCTGNGAGGDGVPVVVDPAMSKLGFLQPGQLGLPGEQITWVVTISNPSGSTLSNVVVTDTLIPELRINNVATTFGTANVSGQTVLVDIPTLNSGQTVTVEILTTVLSNPDAGVFENEVFLTADGGIVVEAAAVVLGVSGLPETGYPPPRSGR